MEHVRAEDTEQVELEEDDDCVPIEAVQDVCAEPMRAVRGLRQKGFLVV